MYVPVELVRCGFKFQFRISVMYLLLGDLVHLYFVVYSKSYFSNFQDCFAVKLDFNVYKVSMLIHSNLSPLPAPLCLPSLFPFMEKDLVRSSVVSV